jgi:hypothetical protein
MYVTVKIVDPIKKKLYLANPQRIPKCSPGVLDHDFKNVEHGKTVLENIDLVHLAGVQKGAYGEKARMYAKCQGGYECVNQLKGASEVSSLGENSTQNTDIMSDQSNPLSNVPNGQENNELPTQNNNESQSTTNEQPAQQLLDSSEVSTNNNNNNESQNEAKPDKTSKSPFRLKQSIDFQNLLSKPASKQVGEEIKIPNWKEDPEYVKLQNEVEQLKREKELEKSKAKYAEIIPKQLFVLNGKFDAIGYNKELEKAVKKNVDPEYAAELYKLKLEKLTLTAGNKIGKPFGASDSNHKEYKTPDTVPDTENSLKGASDINSSQFSGLYNICKMVGLVKQEVA